MTEAESREVLEKKMAKAIKKAAKDIVSPPRSCSACAAIGVSSRFGTDSPRREALLVEIDRDSGKAIFRTYRNGDPHISGPDGTIDQVAVIALAFLLDLECRSLPVRSC